MRPLTFAPHVWREVLVSLAVRHGKVPLRVKLSEVYELGATLLQQTAFITRFVSINVTNGLAVLLNPSGCDIFRYSQKLFSLSIQQVHGTIPNLGVNLFQDLLQTSCRSIGSDISFASRPHSSPALLMHAMPLAL